MTTYTKVILSGCTNGKGIKIAATSSGSGTLIHNAHATDTDEVWLWAVNSSNATVKLTIDYGTHDAPDGNIEVGIPSESGLVLVVPGLILQNDLDIDAFAATADVIIVYGFVNRITA